MAVRPAQGSCPSVAFAVSLRPGSAHPGSAGFKVSFLPCAQLIFPLHRRPVPEAAACQTGYSPVVSMCGV